MLHTEVVSLDLTVYYSIQKWKLFVRARLLFNITTILTEMVLNHFDVMINYIIAVSLHVRRNNVFRFLSTSIFGSNNKLLDQETQLQYATFGSLHSRLLFQYQR